MILAVVKMNDNSLESDRAITHFQLNGPETAAGTHMNIVVIRPAIYVRLSEIFPSPFVTTSLSARRNAETEQQQQRNSHTNQFVL
jgi:hypothetical protein